MLVDSRGSVQLERLCDNLFLSCSAWLMDTPAHWSTTLVRLLTLLLPPSSAPACPYGLSPSARGVGRMTCTLLCGPCGAPRIVLAVAPLDLRLVVDTIDDGRGRMTR